MCDGLTEKSRSINKDPRVKALRKSEAERKGKQLNSVDFTKYMGEQQGQYEQIKERKFKFYKRKYRRRMKRAILSIQCNKTVGVN